MLKLYKPIEIFFEEIKKGFCKYWNILENNNNFPLLRCSASRYKWAQTDQKCHNNEKKEDINKPRAPLIGASVNPLSGSLIREAAKKKFIH